MVNYTIGTFGGWPLGVYQSSDHSDYYFGLVPHTHGMWRYGPAPKPKGPATLKKHRKSKRRH